jgi:hypothetical protein
MLFERKISARKFATTHLDSLDAEAAQTLSTKLGT